MLCNPISVCNYIFKLFVYLFSTHCVHKNYGCNYPIVPFCQICMLKVNKLYETFIIYTSFFRYSILSYCLISSPPPPNQIIQLFSPLFLIKLPQWVINKVSSPNVFPARLMRLKIYKPNWLPVIVCLIISIIW